MEIQFNDYLRRCEQARTLAEKQALSAQFAMFYDSLSAEDKQAMTQDMHPDGWWLPLLFSKADQRQVDIVKGASPVEFVK